MPNSKQNPLLNYRTLTDEDRFLNQQNKINAKYDNQINNLNLGKTTQQQQADITRSQLQKYLPYYYKSKGLSGLGLEQSAMLDANANYTNQLGQIENNFTQQKNALENYRQDDLMKAENDYLDRIDTNSMSAYKEVTNPLENYIFDEKLTADEISKTESLLELYRDQMTQTDITMAENLLNNYKTQFGEEQKTEATTPLLNEVASFVNDVANSASGWKAENRGNAIQKGMYVDAKITTPSGETISLGDLYKNLISELTSKGYGQEAAEHDARAYILTLQEKLGIAKRGNETDKQIYGVGEYKTKDQQKIIDMVSTDMAKTNFMKMNEIGKKEYVNRIKKVLTEQQIQELPSYLKEYIKQNPN